MLDDPATPDAVRRVLEMIRRNVELEARLIDDLLDLTRIIQGKLRLDREVVDAHRLILEALEICRAGIDGGRASASRSTSRPTRHHVEADPARLQQVVWNLIKNAVKFTPDGGSDRDPDPRRRRGRLVVEVADTGVGIDPEVLPRIFDAFEQGGDVGHPAVRRARAGPGDQPEPGRGPRRPARRRQRREGPGRDLHAGLPAVDAPARPPTAGPGRPTAAAGPAARSGSCWSRTTPTRSGSWPGCSGRRGHQVATADGVASALRVGRGGRVRPADQRPRPARRQRARPDPPAPRPAARSAGIALSGYGMDDDLRRSREAGFVEHLTKPVDFRQPRGRHPPRRSPARVCRARSPPRRRGQTDRQSGEKAWTFLGNAR